MELRVLRYFLMVAQEGSLTRAAHQLHITQPTLSRQMMQLEDELGCKLMIRSSHSLQLTEEGRRLVRQARELVDLHDKTVESFVHQQELEGEIGIGTGEFESFALLAQWLQEFQTLHPGIRYFFFSGSSEYIMEQLDAGTLDLGLLMHPPRLDLYRCWTMPLPETWTLIVPKDHPLADHDCIEPAHLKGLTMALPSRPSVLADVRQWLQGIPVQSAAAGNLPYNVALYAQSAGIPYFTLNLESLPSGMKKIPLDPPLYSQTVLVWKQSATHTPLVRALCTFLSGKLEST